MEGDLETLVSRSQEGDKDSFGEIYRLFLKRVYRFIFLKVGDGVLAEDLTQTTFLKTWAALPNFSPAKGTFQAYLFRIAHNLVVDEFRKKKENVSLELLAEPASNESLEEETLRQSEKELVRNFLRQLKAEDLELIKLYYFEELTSSEVAQVVGKNEGAVRVKIHRLLKNLKVLMDNQI